MLSDSYRRRNYRRATEDSMPSKRMVPAQQLSDAGEDLVRLAAAKDAEIAALTEQRDRAMKALIAVSEMLYQRPDMVAAIRSLMGPAEHVVFDEAAAALHAALDAEAAAETEGT